MPDEADKRLLDIARGLLSKTRASEARWAPTDDERTFVYGGSGSSIVVTEYLDAEGDSNVRLSILNGRGTEVAQVRSTWDNAQGDPWENGPGYTPGPNNKLLAELYEAARRSALMVDEVLDSISKDLGLT